MKLVFLGHSAFQIISREGLSILIDPFLDQNPIAPQKSSDLKADYIVLSHAHFDHLGDTARIADDNTTVICVTELAGYLHQKGLKVHGMQVGGAYTFPFGRLKLTMALHGSATPDGHYAGLAAGILLFIDDKVIYHTGDTGLFGDMKLIGEMYPINVLLLPIGGNYTMDIEDAVIAASWIKPELSIPMHYGDQDLIKADPLEFKKRLSSLGLGCHVMQPGETLQI